MAYATETLESLRQQVETRWEGSAFWTTEDADDALGMVCRVWQAATGRWPGVAAVPGVPYDPYVSAGTLTVVTAVRYQEIPLTRTSVAELSHMRPNWRAETPGSAAGVPGRPWYWAPVGLNAVAVWPVPTVPFSLLLSGWARPPLHTTVTPSASVDLPVDLVGVLVDAAAWWGAGKSGAARQQQFGWAWTALLDALLPAAVYDTWKAPFRAWSAVEPSPTFPRTAEPTEPAS